MTMSSGKLRALFVGLNALLVAVGTRQGNFVAIAAQQVAQAKPRAQQSAPAQRTSSTVSLERLNRGIAAAKDPAPFIPGIAAIDDPSSVPFLAEALANEGNVPREGSYGAVDTRFQLLDALQVITNHDAGRNGDDWRAWYEQNKGKTKREWIKEGFLESGFPYSDPPDDAFVSSLIAAADYRNPKRYLAVNALKVLATVPGETIVRLSRVTSGSEKIADRRGTICALRKVKGTSRLEVLRNLTKDRDVDIADLALIVVNEALRSMLPTSAEVLWDVRLARENVHVLNVLDDRTVLLGLFHPTDDKDRVAGFDLVAHKIIWSYRTPSAVGSNAARIGDRLYFISNRRVIHCISVRGKPVWAKPLTTNFEQGTRGPPIVAALGRLFVADGQSVYVITPDGEIQTFAVGAEVLPKMVAGERRVFSAVHDGPLLVFDDPNQPSTRVDTGLKIEALSGFGDSICAVSYEWHSELQCLDQATLRERWRVPLPDLKYVYYEVHQDRGLVFASARGRVLAFDAETGNRVWTANDFLDAGFFATYGRAALSNHYDLEVRDTASGEVIALLGKSARSFASRAVVVGENVLVKVTYFDNLGDGLRLLKIDDGLKRQLGIE
jgi:outer membrane protein assembly factor BamB